MPRVIRFSGVVERLASEVPRFVAYSGAAWAQTETFVIDLRINVELIRVHDPLVPELRSLLEVNPTAKTNFECPTPAQRRVFCLEVADARSSEARSRRAARLLKC